MKALIIEPDKRARDELVTIIGAHFEVSEATAGNEAVEQFRAALERGRPFGLILLDSELGALTGIDVLKLVRELESEFELHGSAASRVLFVSSSTDKTVIVNAFKEGCDGFLLKPLKLEELEKQMKAMGLLQGALSATPRAKPPPPKEK